MESSPTTIAVPAHRSWFRRAQPTPARGIALPVSIGVVASVLIAATDWFLLRAAWLAEDAGPRFTLGALVLLVALVRVGVAALTGWFSRNVGLGVGIASTVATFFVWRPVMGTLPGAGVVDDLEHTFAIPEWSFTLILAWTMALIGFWVALLWPDQNWPARLRNAAPFLIGIAVLLLALRPFS